MAGYIGKISAVVTANTSDLQRKMAGAADATQKFADTLNRSLNKSSQDAKASLEKIFTPLQQLERKLAAARSANIRFGPGKGVTDAQADSLRALKQTVEQLNRPLEEAAKKFISLGLGVQAGFAGALQRAQTAVVAVNNSVQDTGRISASSFSLAEAQVNAVTQSLQRLAQAQQIAGQSLTGRELQFTSPAFSSALTANAATSQSASKLSTAALSDGSVAKQVQQLEQYKQAALSAQATVENLELNPNVNPAVLAAAKKRFEDLTETYRRAGAALQEVVSGEAIANANKYLTIIDEEEAKLDRIRLLLAQIQQKRQATADSLAAGFSPAGVSSTLDSTEVSVSERKIDVLRSQISGLSSSDAKIAEAAIGRLGTALSETFRNGTIRTKESRAEIERLTNQAIAATAAVSGISFDKLSARIKSVGDVARGSFGNAGLAVQQAAFAIDDFFSVTGGLDQRIRAAGNNISQLGFILGGTTGLIAGIAASITSQLVVAFIRWSTGAEVAEARTKALNDSLGKQKSAVESLAQAYRSLASDIAKAGATERGRREIEVRQRADEIRRLEEESNRENVAAFSPEVARIRGERGILEQRLEREQGLEERLRIQAQIDANRRREEDAVRRGIPRPTRGQVAADAVAGEEAAVRQAEIRLRRARLRGQLGGAAPAGEDIATLERNLEARRASLAATRQGGAAAAPREQLRLLETVRARLEDERAAVARLREQGERIDISAIDAAIDDVTVSIRRIETALAPEVQAIAGEFNQRALRLSNTLNAIAESAGGSGLALEAERLSSRLSQLRTELSSATSPEQARAIASQAAAIQAEVNSLNLATQALDRFAEALDRARQEAQSNLQSAQSAADQARRQDLGFSTAQTQGARAQAEADLARQRELATNVDVEAEAARERFSQEASRVATATRRGQLAQEALAGTARARELLRQNNINLPGGTPYSTIAARLRGAGNEQAAREVEQINQRQAEIESQLGLPGGQEFWNGVRAAVAEYEEVVNSATADTQRALARVSEIDSLLGTSGVLAPGQRERLAAERAGLEQQAVELDDRVRAARDASTREAEQAASAARGRDLSLTDGQRAAEGLARNLEDVRQFFGRQAIEGTGLIDQGAQAAAQQRLIDDARRSVAPALAAIREASENAVLQGPSRARLDASDITTQQGTNELNRLLRGDDSSRQQNLVELRKQTQELRLLNANLAGLGFANA